MFHGIFVEMRFGEGVKLWREYKGWTQEELAEKGGLNNNTVSQIEIDFEREPQPLTKKKVAKALGIEVEQVYSPPITRDDAALKVSLTLEDIMDQLKSVYASGTYTKNEIEREVLKFWLEIKSGDKD